MDHSNPLQSLYGDYNIEGSVNAKKDDFRFTVKVNFKDDGESHRCIEAINVSRLDQSNLSFLKDANIVFDTENEATEYRDYMQYVDNIYVAAKRVNIADNNYKPDFSNEDERKYIIRYNGRNSTLTYDYVYAVMDSAIDYNIVFRTQQIAENFINNFSATLKHIMRYRLEKLKD